ncbi:MAG: arginine deiminase [Actinobacteria bacterium]|nr:arginine deiminase [Actinomycetota bacterium]
MDNGVITGIPYGCEEFGRLTHVMLHRPGSALGLIDKHNHQRWLFDHVPDIDRFVKEHDAYRRLLIDNDIEVIELSDCLSDHQEYISRMPNLTYLHDTAVITSKGAILSKMAWEGRRDEHVVVKEALKNLGIPVLIEFEEPDDAFEGCLVLSGETVLVAETERHSRSSVSKFINRALDSFSEVISVEIPKARRYMHPDTIYNRISFDLALAYLPAFKKTHLFTRDHVEEIDFERYMNNRGIEIISISDKEQRNLACSFVPVEPGVILHYDTALSDETFKELKRRGVDLILFHPEAMTAGGGSLRCMTMRLHRESI